VSFSFSLLAPTDYSRATFAWTAIALEFAIHPTGLELVGDNPKRDSAFRALPLIPGLQVIHSFPNAPLFCVADQLFKDSHPRLAAYE
jgi:hypothetical protein